MSVDTAVLADRAILSVTGPDARDFLQRLITNDVETLATGAARYAALLTPQGKILTDFFVVATQEDGFLLDAPLVTGPDLARKLVMYRLRAKVAIEDRTAALGVVVFAGAEPAGMVVAYDDPRDPTLWRRAVVAREALPVDVPDGRLAYRRQRIDAGVPEGGIDFVYGDSFPHEANLDHLQGVDFKKGCYVGQEVVSRVQHRGTARKRIVRAQYDGEAPAPGSEITDGEVAIGVMGSAEAGHGLAMVRIDRLDAAPGGVSAAGVPLRLFKPAWA